MSIETAVVIGPNNQVIHWHFPPGRTSVYLPDDLSLWQIIWNNRDNLIGVAHSHPGSGIPGPSNEDITTFSAIELSLGKRLNWWICSSDHVRLFRWYGNHKYDYQLAAYNPAVEKIWKENWLNELRYHSYGETK